MPELDPTETDLSFDETAAPPQPAEVVATHTDTAAARRKTIGGLIRGIREMAGRKPKDLADFVGISAPAINAIEKGEKEPTLPQLEAIAYYLRVPVHTLMGQSTLPTAEKPPANLEEILRLRGHIIGARLKQARMALGESIQDSASRTGLSSTNLQAYELGKKQPGVSELERLMAHFSLTLDEMLDIGVGPLGEAQLLQQQRAQFEALPDVLREFIADPANLPQLTMALRLRGLSAEQLSALADAFAVLAAQAASARVVSDTIG
jgi:transcriptional regulator with XRE-family HTH domain